MAILLVWSSSQMIWGHDSWMWSLHARSWNMTSLRRSQSYRNILLQFFLVSNILTTSTYHNCISTNIRDNITVEPEAPWQGLHIIFLLRHHGASKNSFWTDRQICHLRESRLTGNVLHWSVGLRRDSWVDVAQTPECCQGHEGRWPPWALTTRQSQTSHTNCFTNEPTTERKTTYRTIYVSEIQKN